MVPQPLHRLLRLVLDVRHELRIEVRVAGAAEHEVLPHHDAQLVARAVEGLGLVDPPAPDAIHVHVAGDAEGHQVPVLLGRDSCDEVVGRDPVRALAEDPPAVHREVEAPAQAVRVGLLE